VRILVAGFEECPLCALCLCSQEGEQHLQGALEERVVRHVCEDRGEFPQPRVAECIVQVKAYGVVWLRPRQLLQPQPQPLPLLGPLMFFVCRFRVGVERNPPGPGLVDGAD